jgi:uncharacterized membrane protein
MMTTTTVGFGDFFPTTSAGRFLAGVLAYSGILAIAMPVTILGNNFTKEYTKYYDEKAAHEEALRARRRKVRVIIIIIIIMSVIIMFFIIIILLLLLLVILIIILMKRVLCNHS